MYVVTGATGNTGKVVAETLLARKKKVRVVGRDAARLKSFVEKGAEPFVASLEDANAITRAFSGAQAVYAMIPPNPAAAEDFRGYQNRVGKALAEAIRVAGVQYVVSLSSVGADLSSGNGPVAGLHDLEQHLNALPKVNALHLRPGYFMENLLGSIGMIKQMGVNGGAVLPDLKVTMVAARDIGAYAARRLLALDFTGKSFQDLHGQRDLTMTEVTRVLGEAIGKPDLKYVPFSYEDTEKGMIAMGLPPKIAAMYVELSRASNEGRLRHVRPRSAESTSPTSIEEFARTFAAIYQSC